jgi:hypothetical protein
VKTPRAAFLIGLTILALILSACAQAALAPDKSGEVPTDLAGVPSRDLNFGGPVPAPDEAGGGSVVGDPAAAPEDRSIVKTGEITVEVDNVAETAGAVRALAVQLDGYISNSSQGDLQEAATLTLRIPADRFDEAIAGLHDLGGDVKFEATSADDITTTVVDTEARLANLKAAEEQYRALLERAEKIEDILAIQNQLFQVRGEIESMQAQLEYLNDQADLATITVTIVPVAEPVQAATEDFDPGAIVKEAVASLVSFGQWLVSAGIWFVIVGIPALLVLGVVLFVAIRIVRRFSGNRGAAAAPAASPEPPAAS